MLPKMERIIGTTGREKQVYQIHLVSQRNWIYIYIYNRLYGLYVYCIM